MVGHHNSCRNACWACSTARSGSHTTDCDNARCCSPSVFAIEQASPACRRTVSSSHPSFAARRSHAGPLSFHSTRPKSAWMSTRGPVCPIRSRCAATANAHATLSFPPLTETATAEFDASKVLTSSEVLTCRCEFFRNEGAVRRRLTSMSSYIAKMGLRVTIHLRS